MTDKCDSRRYITERARDKKPLPDRDAIRREMGWDMIEAQRVKELPLPHEPRPKID